MSFEIVEKSLLKDFANKKVNRGLDEKQIEVLIKAEKAIVAVAKLFASIYDVKPTKSNHHVANAFVDGLVPFRSGRGGLWKQYHGNNVLFTDRFDVVEGKPITYRNIDRNEKVLKSHAKTKLESIDSAKLDFLYVSDDNDYDTVQLNYGVEVAFDQHHVRYEIVVELLVDDNEAVVEMACSCRKIVIDTTKAE